MENKIVRTGFFLMNAGERELFAEEEHTKEELESALYDANVKLRGYESTLENIVYNAKNAIQK